MLVQTDTTKQLLVRKTCQKPNSSSSSAGVTTRLLFTSKNQSSLEISSSHLASTFPLHIHSFSSSSFYLLFFSFSSFSLLPLHSSPSHSLLFSSLPLLLAMPPSHCVPLDEGRLRRCLITALHQEELTETPPHHTHTSSSLRYSNCNCKSCRLSHN